MLLIYIIHKSWIWNIAKTAHLIKLTFLKVIWDKKMFTDSCKVLKPTNMTLFSWFFNNHWNSITFPSQTFNQTVGTHSMNQHINQIASHSYTVSRANNTMLIFKNTKVIKLYFSTTYNSTWFFLETNQQNSRNTIVNFRLEARGEKIEINTLNEPHTSIGTHQK